MSVPAPTATAAPRERIVVSDTAALAVYERGTPSADRPTLVMTHGWPDSSAVWDPVVAQLADRFHVVTYDARGVGRSTPAMGHRPYALERLAGDMRAVIDAVSPDRPVHLVGHDWGSVQGWELVTTPEHEARVASFTSLSGMSLDHTSASFRARLRRPMPRNLAPVAAQLAKSSYTFVLSVPVVSTLMWRLGFGRLFRRWLQISEGVPRDDGYPSATLAADAIAAVPLYLTNIFRRALRPDPRPTRVPVQLIVATKDRYVSPRTFADIDQWVPDLVRRVVPAGHWSPRTHPDAITALVTEFVDAVRARPLPPERQLGSTSAR